MKIKEIRAHLLQKNLTSSMKISRGGFKVRRHVIVEVITDEGVTGLGEAVGDAYLIQQILSGSISQKALGLDPMNIEVIRSKLIDNEVYMEQKGSVICAVFRYPSNHACGLFRSHPNRTSGNQPPLS